MTPLAFLNIGTFELVVLAAAAILLFGGDLPDVARKAAVWVQKIRSLSTDLTRELNRQVPPELKLPPDVKPRGLDMPDELKLTAKERAIDATWRPKSSPPGPEDPAPFGTREDEPASESGAADDSPADASSPVVELPDTASDHAATTDSAGLHASGDAQAGVAEPTAGAAGAGSDTTAGDDDTSEAKSLRSDGAS